MQIHAHNLEPALQWVEEHRQELAKQPQAVGFEFKLYRLSFLRILNEQGHSTLAANPITSAFQWHAIVSCT